MDELKAISVQIALKLRMIHEDAATAKAFRSAGLDVKMMAESFERNKSNLQSLVSEYIRIVEGEINPKS